MNENQNEYVDINAHDNYPDSEQTIEIPTMKVIPLKKICMTIGALPTAYLETMSYYEMLIWFIEYLKNNIIPTINNNASAVQEVQSVVLALQNYINNYKDSIDSDVEELEEYMNNYFENLDVQEEINNKLDEYVADGTLEHIIASYLNTQKIYNTHAEMIADSSSLVNGLKVQTLGYSSINDGGGAFYYITDSSSNPYYKENLGNNLYAVLITNEPYKYNVLSLGFNPDGDINNSSALHNFITAYTQDRLILYFPKGNYYINKTNDRNFLPDSTSIIGDDAYIFFNDDEDVEGVSMLSGATKKFELKGIEFKSTFDIYGQETNTAQLYYEEFDTTSPTEQIINIENCKFSYFRKTLMSSSRSNYVTIKNCEYHFISRDCNRFLGAKFSLVENCKFYSCGDDLISTHGNVADSTHIFAHNYCYASFGVGILGGKYIDIHDNEFVLPFMLFKSGTINNEGGPTELVNFHDNKVVQPAHTAHSGRLLCQVCAQTNKVLFNNNVVEDGSYEKVDFVNVGDKYLNDDLTKGMFLIYVMDNATLKYLEMIGNYYNAPFGPSTLQFGDTQLLRGQITDLQMRNNKIENFYSIICTTPKLNWIVENNYFNGDTQHLLTTDGSFVNSSALRVFNAYPTNFRYNYLRNISGNFSINHENYIYYQPDGKYMNPTQAVSPCKWIPYTESTGIVSNDTIEVSNTMPTTGYYHQGDYVRALYTIDSNPIGWYRLTTGNNHVLGTDWKAVYPKTSA